MATPLEASIGVLYVKKGGRGFYSPSFLILERCGTLSKNSSYKFPSNYEKLHFCTVLQLLRFFDTIRQTYNLLLSYRHKQNSEKIKCIKIPLDMDRVMLSNDDFNLVFHHSNSSLSKQDDNIYKSEAPKR